MPDKESQGEPQEEPRCDCGDALSSDFIAWVANQVFKSLRHQATKHGIEVPRFTLLIDDPDGKTVIGVSSPSSDLTSEAERRHDMLDAKARLEQYLKGLTRALDGDYIQEGDPQDGIGTPAGNA